MSSGLEQQLIDLLTVFLIAGGVGALLAKIGRVPYTIALLLAGFAASIAGLEIDITLTHDIILLVVLPPLLFEGAATTDIDEFRSNFSVMLTLATVGLAASIVVVGVVSTRLLGYSLLLGLLFGTIILPTDPVSVLALFKQVGAPERLSVLVEGESLLNDGVAVVIFSALLALVEAGDSAADLATLEGIAELAGGIIFSAGGGAIVGLAAGYLIYRLMANLDEHMTEIILTVVLAYGAFLVAEHYLHVSGVIATVAAGLLIGNRGREYAMSPQTKTAVFNTWETAAYVVNTFIFLLLGVKTPIRQIIAEAELLLPAVVLVLVARAVAVYPLTEIANRFSDANVPRNYQHVLVWGGLHGSIPIALVLGLPEAVGPRQQLRVLVFGIAAFSLVIQGLSMKRFLRAVGVETSGKEEELYNLLLTRAKAVDEALDESERLHERNLIRTDVYERFQREYGREKEELNTVIRDLLEAEPALLKQELLQSERRVLHAEESAITDAELSGQLSTELAEDLIAEVHQKQARLDRGETTVTSDIEREGYREFWRERATAFGLDVGEDVLDETAMEELTDESGSNTSPLDDETEGAGTD
ncbi:na+ antiporter [Halogeometricum borinquense DSM 11551]|uniref:Na+ antiporter n=1 Tax=Halogeometricum borinquense (strain ATCC 700274 / DSM 11551 / JCM 10706 / KCTC 4070 / PR3) TaxID=469382 RepID=E4NSN8_HALBP|nr:Na+/H+ antiporter [Halogeometricum borinquense]ADQ68131.1 Na+ antiporter [Halogeometricum borinquense DSM 11551]ELY24825.1 na+ antiporter [Halogeometricum borinquense DSM 11551]